MLPLIVTKQVLGWLVHPLLCFIEMHVLLMSLWLKERVPEKERTREYIVETLSTCQGNLLHWPLL